MFGWLSRKWMRGFNKREIRKNIETANTFDASIRNLVARDLYLTHVEAELCPASERREHFQSVVCFALARRHNALRSGAKSRHDPPWNVASTIESIATLHCSHEVGRIANRALEAALRPSKDFVDRNLSFDEKKVIRDKMAKREPRSWR